MKKLLIAFLTAIIVGGLILVNTVHFGTVKASTDVVGIITLDTTWTKANSPYTLTGPVGVAKGVTLTIEAGVTMNGPMGMVVNGTLRARGSNSEPIHFNSIIITFTQYSTSWIEQTGSGSIIENAILSDTEININNTSPKINGNSINGTIDVDYEGSPIISNNIITGRISIGRGSAINNTIFCDYYGISADGSATILNNTIIGGSEGRIGISADDVYIFGNVVSGFETGIKASRARIEKNLVCNNYFGIDTDWGGNLIQNNTIINNSEGLYLGVGSETITYNNILNNSKHNIYMNPYSTHNATAIYNWWGTTDAQSISQTIHNNWNDFNLITVNFVPFLTAPNPEAPSIVALPTTTPTPAPSPSPSPSPTPSPDQSDNQTLPQTGLSGTEVAIIIALVVIASIQAVTLALVLKKKRS